jgi:hypothetical protein
MWKCENALPCEALAKEGGIFRVPNFQIFKFEKNARQKVLAKFWRKQQFGSIEETGRR